MGLQRKRLDSDCVYPGALSGAFGMDAVETGRGECRLWGGSSGLFDNDRWAINNQLRTGADKGTPTV